MPEYRCEKCGANYYGWGTDDTCSLCGGKMWPGRHCPVCVRHLDDATWISGEKATPSPGALAICFYCGAFLRFDEDRSLKLLSTDELSALNPSHQTVLSEIRTAILDRPVSGREAAA